jgi:hypothetical protein
MFKDGGFPSAGSYLFASYDRKLSPLGAMLPFAELPNMFGAFLFESNRDVVLPAGLKSGKPLVSPIPNRFYAGAFCVIAGLSLWNIFGPEDEDILGAPKRLPDFYSDF